MFSQWITVAQVDEKYRKVIVKFLISLTEYATMNYCGDVAGRQEEEEAPSMRPVWESTMVLPNFPVQRGSQSRTCCRRGRREPASTSTWVRRRRATRPTRPFTGSMWLAIRTHLCVAQVTTLKATALLSYFTVCGGTRCRLVHGTNDVWTLGVLGTQEAVEHISQCPSMVQVVQDDDQGQVGTVVLTLITNVGQKEQVTSGWHGNIYTQKQLSLQVHTAERAMIDRSHTSTYLNVAIYPGDGSFSMRVTKYSANFCAKYVFPVPDGPQRMILRCSVRRDTYLCTIDLGIIVSKAKASTWLILAPFRMSLMAITSPTKYP
ncbi:hypothetical protein E2C01_015675 [Portunus trituberculatus]|uniref:Uncharacterized protein n=1 Tax=Portunus trituberculatus TaxID=210409 RepID=A0A5B7DN95_PORTR|nr:hypothetical protein [Portunus trituberculatus]